MLAARGRSTVEDWLLVLAGVAVTLAASYLTATKGVQIGLGPLVVAAFGVGVVLLTIGAPHLSVTGMIVLFTLIPALKVFTFPTIGALKDLYTVAAVAATVVLVVIEKRRPEPRVFALVVLLLVLYAVNAGGGHSVAWGQGLRLVGEPLLLLLVGLTLPDPRRTLRWAVGALIATACFAAGYGLLQQVLGEGRLISLGYSYDLQVRTANGLLRSFSTFDDPFAYAAFLLFGIVAVVFAWRRGGLLPWGIAGLLLAGLAVSFVRTAVLLLFGVLGLQLARWGGRAPGVMVLAATALAGLVILATNANGSQSQVYSVPSQPAANAPSAPAQSGQADILLNGRISAWTAAVGDNPREWLFGRGVGKVGTAAERSTYNLAPSSSQATAAVNNSQAVDSGYLATIADVGFAGLLVQIALLARLIGLGRQGTAQNSSAAWFALGLLLMLMLDALTRASFTGFPTAFLGLLLVGLALAAAREEGALPGWPAQSGAALHT
jgi:hypothetical protein